MSTDIHNLPSLDPSATLALRPREISVDTTLNLVFGVLAFVIGVLSILIAVATWLAARGRPGGRRRLNSRGTWTGRSVTGTSELDHATDEGDIGDAVELLPVVMIKSEASQ